MPQFDPDKYLNKKQQFDPDKFLSSREGTNQDEPSLPKQQPEDISELESFGRGLADEVSFGFADEIESYLRDKPVEEIRERIKQAEEQNPVASGAGTVAGFIGSLLSGAGVAKLGAKGIQQLVKKGISKPAAEKLAAAASKPGIIATGAATGGITEGLSGVGESEASNLADRLEEAAPKALTGLAFGAGIGAGLKAAGKVGSAIKRGADKGIDYADSKSLGLTNRIKADERKQLLDLARKQDIISVNPAETFKRAVQLRENSLADLQTVKKALPNLNIKFIDKYKALRDLDDLAKKADTRTTKDAQRFILDIRKDLQDINPNDIEKMDQLYRRLGSHLRDPGISNAKRSAISSAFAKLSQNIDDTMISSAKQSDTPAIQKLYREVNKNFRLSNKLATAAEVEAGKMTGQSGLMGMSSSDIGRLGVFGLGPAIKFGAIKAGAKAVPLVGSKIKGAALRKKQSLQDVLKSSSSEEKRQTSELLDLLKNK